MIVARQYFGEVLLGILKTSNLDNDPILGHNFVSYNENIQFSYLWGREGIEICHKHIFPITLMVISDEIIGR